MIVSTEGGIMVTQVLGEKHSTVHEEKLRGSAGELALSFCSNNSVF